jgi:non-lysosomal glucosylceramidase
MWQSRRMMFAGLAALAAAISPSSEAAPVTGNDHSPLFSPAELRAAGTQRVFKGDANEAAFLLGGIGTGNVSVGARGDLRDWELTHHPDKGHKLPWSYFAIYTRAADGTTRTKVLESRIQPPHSGGSGYGAERQAGLPRFASSTMRGEYPFVWVTLRDPDMPVQVELEAFTPFVPLDADASGIPATVLRYKVRNTSSGRVSATVAGSLANEACAHGIDKATHDFRTSDGLAGLWYKCPDIGERLKCGSMALVAREGNRITHKREWLRGGWWDGAHDYWDDLAGDGQLDPESRYVSKEQPGPHGSRVGGLGIMNDLGPGEEKVFEFILAWHFPKRPRGWWEKKCEKTSEPCECIMDNYYATRFTDAWNAASHLNRNLADLEAKSRTFHKALFEATLPAYVIDALASNITVIRSSTCFRVADGTFFAWEGCHDKVGCCDGTCTHVWNYAQTLAFLFPELERSIRRVEFNLETDADGKMAFRSRRGFGVPDDSWKHHAAADGQLGTIIRLYRDWKLSGDTEFLRSVWPGASRALDYAFKHWDSDGDCVLDSQQHNTYDIEFYGPNSLVNSMFLGALKAGAAMAEAVGDQDHATTYAQALEKSAPLMDQMLWGGEYYIQQLANVTSTATSTAEDACRISCSGSCARMWQGWGTCCRRSTWARRWSRCSGTTCGGVSRITRACSAPTRSTTRRGCCSARGRMAAGRVCRSCTPTRCGPGSSTRWRRT